MTPIVAAHPNHAATTADVLVLGCGYVGSAVAQLARSRGDTVRVTTRSAERTTSLERQGFAVLELPTLDENVSRHVGPRTHAVVAFPPDGHTDARLANSLSSARAITYVSSTGVYGDHCGRLDDGTPLPSRPTERAERILQAEARYRALGATVLRCPGIYGEGRGLHQRVLRGVHRIPGDGSRTLSRIHVEDLAALVLAARDVRGETFVVGDLEPAPHIEVVRFICATYGVPLPPCVPLEEVHESLRANRQVDPSRALRMLQVTLRFPSFRQGMMPPAAPLGSP